MLTNLTYEEAKATAETRRCGECDSGLLAPHLGNGEFGVRCAKDANHQGVARPRQTKKLADGKEYDIMTQRPVDETQALAVPNTREGMAARMQEAQAVGLWPQKMDQRQEAMLVQVALAYELDPFMGEIMPYQGRPFITIAGRRRKDADAGHKPSIRFRPLTQEERQMYEEAEVLTEGDLAGMCVLTTEWGSEVEAFAKVTRAERQARNNRGDGLRSPVVANNPIEMVQKRAERRAREMAYGPIARPAGLDTQIRVIEEGDYVEGEARAVDTTTGEIREPQEAPTGDMYPPDEGPDGEAPEDTLFSEKPALPAEVTSITVFWEVVKPYGWDLDRVNRELGMEGPVPNYLQAHGNRQKGVQALYQWWKDKAGV